jgi:hypothetical protein
MKATKDVTFPSGLIFSLAEEISRSIPPSRYRKNNQTRKPALKLPQHRNLAIMITNAAAGLYGKKNLENVSGGGQRKYRKKHYSSTYRKYLLLPAVTLFSTGHSFGATTKPCMLFNSPIFAVIQPVTEQYITGGSALPAGTQAHLFRPAAWMRQPLLAVWYGEMIVTVVLGLALLIYLRHVYDRKKEKVAYNNRLLEMQAKALTNQMNPHFIYNSLSTVQHLIMIDEKQKAFDYISDFSLLMRQMLTNTRKSYISLDDEVDFLKRYLELEKIRFINAFQYEFHMDNELKVHSYCIPSMLIQPILENAIKHGFSPKKENNLLKISLSVQKDILECVVDDNGIGWRKKNSDFASLKHESTALTILRERLNLIKSYNGNSGNLEIIDKFIQDNTQSGTIVKIYIPIINSL